MQNPMVLQNPIDEQGTTNVDSLWKGTTNHERLRATGLAFICLTQRKLKLCNAFISKQQMQLRGHEILKKLSTVSMIALEQYSSVKLQNCTEFYCY